MGRIITSENQPTDQKQPDKDRKMKTKPETKPAHSPEPWKPLGRYTIEDARDRGVSQVIFDTEKDVANRDRIVSCVNALSGLNPEAVVDLVDAVGELIHGAVRHGSQEQRVTNYAYKKAVAALAKLRQ